jgi:acetylornithine/N-succinyldiaminopimelate aminotransferase
MEIIMQNIINEAESVLLHTYNRFQVVFDHADGVCLYDTNGKEYLDFVLEQCGGFLLVL